MACAAHGLWVCVFQDEKIFMNEENKITIQVIQTLARHVLHMVLNKYLLDMSMCCTWLWVCLFQDEKIFMRNEENKITIQVMQRPVASAAHGIYSTCGMCSTWGKKSIGVWILLLIILNQQSLDMACVLPMVDNKKST